MKREKTEEVEGEPMVHPRMFGMRLSVHIKFLSGYSAKTLCFVKTIFTVADKIYIVKGDLQDFQLRDKETVCYNSTMSCARESQ